MVTAPSSPAPSSPLASPVPSDRDYYSMSQAAELLGVSRVSIWRWVRAGTLPASRIGPRTTRINRVDLDHLLASRAIARPAPSTGSARDAQTRSEHGSVVDSGQADWQTMGPAEHFVQFYDADDALLDAVAGYIRTGLQAGEASIVLATPEHRDGIEKRLAAQGIEVAAALGCGQYVALDAADMLSTFLVDGMPDPVRFMAVIGGIIAHAAAGGSRIRAFGEMVALLAQEGNHAGAIRLEALWNELQTRYTFALFCAYPMACLGGSTLSDALVEVCAAHGRVIPSESYTSLPRPDDRLRAVVRWQQKAQSLEQALEAERTARQAAEEALRLRDEFLSIASHELNTPITGLSGHVQFLLRQYQRTGHLEPERLAMSLQRIQEQTGKLSRLMSHLLDASRLEAGKLTLERRPTDLSQLVQDTVATLRILDEDHDITVSMPPSLQAFIDPVRLEQVLINLLHNALKYSPDGSEIGVTLADGEDGAVELAVRDRGPGIPPDKREHLFERFYQVHEHCPKQGMGLGLYISRQIVELHGGTLCAEFPSGGGTRFVVRLPIHDRSQATTDEPEDPSIVSRR